MVLVYESEFQPHIDSLDFGESIRINHTNCPSGEDTRRRLYLHKPTTHGGKVLAYCHNCQQGASWLGGENYRISTEEKDAGGKRIKPIDLSKYEPYNMDSTCPGDAKRAYNMASTWPGDAKRELFRYGINGRMSHTMYDPSTHRLVVPVYEKIDFTTNATYNLKGIQKKRLVGTGTKYITEMNNDLYDLSSILINKPVPHKDHIGVIVEDYLSGLRIIQWAQDDFNVKVLVNYGTKVNPEAIKNMTDVSKLIVWLDNDSDHVVEQARTIGSVAKLIQPKDTEVIVHLDHDDPKKASYDTISGVLYG